MAALRRDFKKNAVTFLVEKLLKDKGCP